MRGNKHEWEDRWVFTEAANISSSHSSLTMRPVDSTNGAVNGADLSQQTAATLFNWGVARSTNNFSWTQLSHKGLYTVDVRGLGPCACVCPICLHCWPLEMYCRYVGMFDKYWCARSLTPSWAWVHCESQSVPLEPPFVSRIRNLFKGTASTRAEPPLLLSTPEEPEHFHTETYERMKRS